MSHNVPPIKESDKNKMPAHYESNFLSRLFFCYMNPILNLIRKLPNKGHIRNDEIYQRPEIYSAENVCEEFERQFIASKSLFLAFSRTLGRDFFIMIIFNGLTSALNLLIIIISRQILFTMYLKIQDQHGVNYYEFIILSIILIILLLKAFVQNHGYNYTNHGVSIAYSGIYRLIYSKLLKLTGCIRNTLGNKKFKIIYELDTSKCAEFVSIFTVVVISAANAAISFLLLVIEISWVSLVSVVLFGIGFFLNRKLLKLQRNIGKEKDKLDSKRRILIADKFTGIKSIKIHAIEEESLKEINKVTDSINKLNLKMMIYKSISEIYQNFSLIMSAIIMFFLYQLINKSLNEPLIFYSFILLKLFQFNVSKLFALIEEFLKMRKSFSRINNYLEAEEIEPSFKNNTLLKGSIEIKYASFSWYTSKSLKSLGSFNNMINENINQSIHERQEDFKQSSTKINGLVINNVENNPSNIILNMKNQNNDIIKNVLKDINLQVYPGERICIFGNKSSGKSSFAQAILRELTLTKGSISLNGSIAFVSKDPWIIQDSIKKNIILQQIFEEDKYQEIIEICDLSEEINSFEEKDNAILHENDENINIQVKQKIDFARSLYNEKDIYILDEALNSLKEVDVINIFEKSFKSILKRKSIIFFTSNRKYFNLFYTIIVMKEGKIECSGNIDFVTKNSEELNKIILNKEDQILEDKNKESQIITSTKLRNPLFKNSELVSSIILDASKIQEMSNSIASNKENLLLNILKFIINLIWASPPWIPIAFILLNFAEFIGFLFLLIFIGNFCQTNFSFNLSIAISIGVGLLISIIIKELTFLYWTFLISKNLKQKFYYYLIYSKLEYHERKKTELLITHFEKNIKLLETEEIILIKQLIKFITSIIGSFIVISLSFPYYISFFIIGFPILIYFLNKFINSFKEFKHLENKSKSSLTLWFEETLKGLITIRAYDYSQVMIKKMNNLINNLSNAFIMLSSGMRWIHLRTDLVFALILSSLFLFIIVFSSWANSNIYFLSVVYLFEIHSNYSLLISLTLITSQVSSSIRSIFPMLETLSKEPNDLDSDKKKLNNWPMRGQIIFNNLNIKLNDKINLKDFTYTIEPNEKIALVGKKHSGKSMIIHALFRLIDPIQNKDHSLKEMIKIDGISIFNIEKKLLRSSLSVITNPPLVYSGTIKYFLDPHNQFEESDLINTIIKVGLLEQILYKINNSNWNNKFSASVPRSDSVLSFIIERNGKFLSLQEKILLNWAKIILLKPKIIIIDESNIIDEEIDIIEQKLFEEELKNSTIIKIVHKLKSIFTYQKILVLEGGNLIEEGIPINLINNENSKLNFLIRENDSLNKGYFDNCVQAYYDGTEEIAV